MPCRVSLPRLALIIGSLSASGASLAQSTQLDTMSVTAPRLDRELFDTPAPVSVIDKQDIARGQQRERLNESLAIVPGLYLQNSHNFVQGERISIRGFGARTPWGVRGITVRVDGIPYTLPDGQAQLDAIDLESAERIEVIRGPAAVQYGNAAGGVIDVTTADGASDPGTSLRIEGGSNGYRKLNVSNGGVEGPWTHHISASALGTDGYRDHADVEKYLLNAKLSRQLDEDRSLTAIVNLLDNPRSEDPGALTEAGVARDRSGTLDDLGYYSYSPTRIGAGQTVEQQVLGLEYEDLSAGPGELTLRGFYQHRDFAQQLAYAGPESEVGVGNFVAYERDYFGANAEYRQSLTLGDLPLSYVSGIDVARQADERYRDDVAINGEHLRRSADETQTATSVGAFVQGDLELSDQWTLSLGTRFDHTQFDIDDHYLTDGDNGGDRSFEQWSGSAGLSYRYLPNHQAYLSTGTAYETPTFAEFANPAGVGGFNPDLEPQKAWNREIGLRGSFVDAGLDYDVALFSTRVRDSLISYTLAGRDRDFYRNAGRSRQEGLEVSLGWQFADSWRLDSALTLARYEFQDYADQDGNYDNNRIPGIPERTWVNQLTWQGVGERFATLETRYVGSMYADDANSVKVDDYWLANLRAGDGWKLSQDTSLKAYVGVQNLFDREHYDNISINANNGRYFYTAPDRSAYAGLELTF
ncbi:TonB-dependent receptor family protein [Halomonas halmophila]|uniref:TonB-dependent receptor n=1 Tax=Halomonas halmophila TaxID=252 RepID=A0A4Y4F9D2_9GAMM|nr:TonB-dependent receptor [Halomonas halmophila]GED23718.1 TonB-dependent receptor [Halomonas halmophila]